MKTYEVCAINVLGESLYYIITFVIEDSLMVFQEHCKLSDRQCDRFQIYTCG